MNKSNTPGKILSLLHLGYSVRDRGNSLDFHSDKMDAKGNRTQRGDAPYISMVIGVKGTIMDSASIEYGENRPMVELLQFINPPPNVIREYKPGEPSYSQIGYHTSDIRACYDRMIEKELTPLGPVTQIDYGFGKGREAFLLKDPDNMYVQIVQDEKYEQGQGKVIGQDHLVLSVPNLDETIPIFRDLLCSEVKTEDVSGSEYLSSYCQNPVKRVAVCKFELENYTVELWETGGAGGVENLYISEPGSIHLCFSCQGIDNLYEQFKAAGMRFVNEPVLVTKGVNEGAKAIFSHAPGYLWFELLCRKDRF